MMAAKSIDLLKAYSRKPELSQSKKGLIVFGAAAIAVAAIFGAVVFGMNARLRALDAQCKSEKAYIDDATVQQKYASYEQTSAEYARELALSDELQTAVSAIKSYPTVNSPLLRAVNSASGDKTTLATFDYSDASGVLRVTGESRDFLEGANYAARLEGLDRFLNVGYNGYYLTDYTYAFEDNCLMKPGSASVTTQR